MYILIFISFCTLLNPCEVIAADNFEFRVENGVKATPKELPYQVALKELSGSWFVTFCGGTIIQPTRVLSAAHCFDYLERPRKPSSICCEQLEDKFKNIYVVGGNLRNVAKYRDNGNEQWRKPHKVIHDKRFKFPEHDIAVIFLKRPFVYNDFINGIPYAHAFEEYEDRKCIASGFGEVKPKVKSDNLMWAYIDVMDHETCCSYFGLDMKNFVCSYTKFGDIGKGDSGGPLVCFKTGHKNEGFKGILLGISCGKGERSSLFTRVSSYLKIMKAAKASTVRPSFISWIRFYFFILDIVVSFAMAIHKYSFIKI